ncbi:TPA: phosphopantetheine-binding protein [Enterococcus faecium]|uniref:phosphopantetheine-binding protein n=1 Tax=Enterococcus faecium TaxID=1352 RepID=UPI0011233AB4|nr:phosphopantetheine-binding protein [Enterococcus faecium]MCU7382711.1 acyl carrier protein [Enterococcus faecium]QDB89943.1 acyl carrier protein [Enterococcus faecium]HAQ7747625.1 acyl carrier protein [Enterococcus faecium]HCD9885511.1 hypothetical protein [Enterococcus faecium]
MEELLQLLKEIKNDVDFEHEKELVDSGLLDSIEIVNVIASMEEKYGFEISPEYIDPDNFQSVEAMWDMIQKIQYK